MGRQFAKIAFTPLVKKQQELHGSRRQYQRKEEIGEPGSRLGENEREFIGDRDGLYIASVSETGWPYIQFRGGPKGFLRVLDDQTRSFADLRGNRQYIFCQKRAFPTRFNGYRLSSEFDDMVDGHCFESRPRHRPRKAAGVPSLACRRKLWRRRSSIGQT